MPQPANIVPIQVPLTTGVVRSFGHTRVQIAGLEFTGGYKQVKLKRTRTREMVMSNSPDPVGKTLGENKYEASIVAYYDWWANMLLTISAAAGARLRGHPVHHVRLVRRSEPRAVHGHRPKLHIRHDRC